MARFETAGSILNDVAVEVNLSAVSDPISSTDPAFIQLAALLKLAGRELALARDWHQLHREATLTTIEADPGVYALPADFVAMVDGTVWDRTNDRELRGPLNAAQWQAAVARAETAPPLWTSFRLSQNQLWLFPIPPATGIAIQFEYRSRYWVQGAAAPDADKDAPTASTDVVLYDPYLVSRAVKLRWLEAKGYDTTSTLGEYARALEAVAATEPAAVLRLGGARSGERFIDCLNLPDTGYGS